jgi:hypothetical protein
MPYAAMLTTTAAATRAGQFAAVILNTLSPDSMTTCQYGEKASTAALHSF